ncbi:MAG: lipase secretion chaperone [Pseudomonadota bacterium]
MRVLPILLVAAGGVALLMVRWPPLGVEPPAALPSAKAELVTAAPGSGGSAGPERAAPAMTKAAIVPLPNPVHPYKDTQVDGDVSLDDAGHFVPDRRALQLFDYFFIESGRLSRQEIVGQIRDWLRSRLQEPALSEALGFLEQYLLLRQLAADAFARGAPAEDPAQRLALIQSLQRRAFGEPLAGQLFDEENRRHENRLARLQAHATGEAVDPTAGLNAAETRVYLRTEAVLDAAIIANEVEDDQQRWDKRSEAFGYDAAYRLAELDRQRAEWDGRVAMYLRMKSTIEADTGLDGAQRAAQLKQLLQISFDPTEQRRVQAQARLAEQSAGR